MSDYRLHSSAMSYFAGWILLVSTLALFSTILIICGVPDLTADSSLIALGAIATWRYTWAAINLGRAVAYQFAAFPRIRRALPARANASHIYVVVLSYHMGADAQRSGLRRAYPRP
ncbi:MAG TPA: hypothetical protein VHT00_12820 [Stellaceae bacterium]|jgi:glycosyltransferase Alg8|nr:hypothetical protein [Stellaceae bacterium]